jgi:predicted nucleotidyltransferase
LRTPAGDLDLTFVPAGFPEGYEGLVKSAQAHTISGITVKVAALNDVIKSKTAAARPKDLDALPELIRIAGQDRGLD